MNLQEIRKEVSDRIIDYVKYFKSVGFTDIQMERRYPIYPKYMECSTAGISYKKQGKKMYEPLIYCHNLFPKEMSHEDKIKEIIALGVNVLKGSWITKK